MLGVVLSKKARARAVQLPAWNEALGLPRPFDQQWSLRMQQIMAYETDLLEHADIFDGSPVIAAKVEAITSAALAELDKVQALGGAASTAGIAYMKEALVAANTSRLKAIEQGDTKVVGVNIFTTGEASPLAQGEGAILTVKDDVQFEQVNSLKAWRAGRDAAAVGTTLAALKSTAATGGNIMEPSIACAKAGVTTGEWAATLRSVFGEFRAPTGVSLTQHEGASTSLEALRTRVHALAQVLGTTPKILIGKPGLDGHSNGAEQIATRAAETGLHVIYEGIRLTPEELVARVADEKVGLLGLSILSGSHVPLVRDVMARLRARNITIPVVIGGIIPEDDGHVLKQLGVSAVFTPKDYDLDRIMSELLTLMERAAPQGQPAL
jgi:ethylmalonyl-CoA mutase